MRDNMTTNADILAAMAAEKERKKAFSLQHPHLGPQLTNADIVKAHQDQVKAGRGEQKIGADSKLGAPKSGASLEKSFDAKNFFNIPGIKEALKNDRS
tara:strand:+ start:2801 stop:3094 length:294 start_codon:yes stop_codon:yes gene_type:complete